MDYKDLQLLYSLSSEGDGIRFAWLSRKVYPRAIWVASWPWPEDIMPVSLSVAFKTWKVRLEERHADHEGRDLIETAPWIELELRHLDKLAQQLGELAPVWNYKAQSSENFFGLIKVWNQVVVRRPWVGTDIMAYMLAQAQNEPLRKFLFNKMNIWRHSGPSNDSSGW